MNPITRFAAPVLSFTLALVLAGLPLQTTVAQNATTVATGLNGPMGVLATPDGGLWVVDTGTAGDETIKVPDLNTHEVTDAPFGHTSRVIRITPDGNQTTAAMLPSVGMAENEYFGGSRVALLGDVLYVTSGGWIGGGPAERPANMASVVTIKDGEAHELATTWDIEVNDNPDGYLVEAHPFGLIAGPDGNLWMTDAAGNAVYMIDPKTGDLTLVALFDGVESPMPNNNRGGAMESDPVPTGLTFDADGNLYVAFLPGFPFLPGSGKVVRVTRDGNVSDYATGLTMITDLTTGPDGQLYAVSFGKFTEQGPTPNSGAVVRVGAGDTSKEIITGLSFPTSIAFSPSGDAYVTVNGVGAPGSGEVVRYDGLLAMKK